MSDSDLAAELAAGDQDALAELYDRYGRLAYAVALRILGDPGRAEDVVQDTFLKLWKNANQFDIERGSLRTWLITAVRNRSIDTMRGRGAHKRQERELKPELRATGPTSDPWREVSLSLERTAIREALDSLPLEQRQAVELAYFGGFSHREIADMAAVPLSTVKGRMRIALEKLNSYLTGTAHRLPAIRISLNACSSKADLRHSAGGGAPRQVEPGLAQGRALDE